MIQYSKTEKTRITILEAAKSALLSEGYAGLSTRKIAVLAGVPMSQIQYHFGSKEGMVLALFEYMNSLLIDRQSKMFNDTNSTLSEKWNLACDYLDDDLASGYVRVLQELTAAGWGNSKIGKIVQEGLSSWSLILKKICEETDKKYSFLGIFKAEEVATLVSCAFLGAESLLLLGMEDQGLPIRKALRKIGKGIRLMEEQE